MEKNKIERPFISIIIPTYKDTDLLTLCLEQLKLQTYPMDSFEIVIINNGAITDLDRLTLSSNAKVIYEPNPGSYSARNSGVKVARGQIIGFVDADCLPHINWIENAVKYFQNSDCLDRVAGTVEIFRENNSSWLVWKYEFIVAFNQRLNVSKIGRASCRERV